MAHSARLGDIFFIVKKEQKDTAHHLAPCAPLLLMIQPRHRRWQF